jgi:Fe-S-cluster-containing hydrogenase component 2
MVCAKRCPVHAIAGESKKPHLVNQDACIRCGACVDVCKFDAVLVE